MGSGVGHPDGVRARRRAETRAATVDVALGLFAERGYDAVTVGDICAAAGIAPRTFFRYFAAKEDLLAEPAREMAERICRYVAVAAPRRDPRAGLAGALPQQGRDVVAERRRVTGFLRGAAGASEVRASPLVRLSDQERRLAVQLVGRRGTASLPDWRTRLLVARSVAAFRVWLDDLVAGREPDPLAHLDEVLAG
jgi:AcrR family transcriptional regulator